VRHGVHPPLMAQDVLYRLSGLTIASAQLVNPSDDLVRHYIDALKDSIGEGPDAPHA
jgi:hypothetical protein